MINICGLDKAAVLAALYNGSHPLGMGFIHATPGDMTVDEARGILGEVEKEFVSGRSRRVYFDYLKGRVLKVDLTRGEFDPRLYDRDNGQGAAADVVERLRGCGKEEEVRP